MKPQGSLVIRTMALPGDSNANGVVFGGWIMAQMDLGSAILAREITNGLVVTAGVDYMNFYKPIGIGDAVSAFAQCVKIGNTSIKIKIEVWISNNSKPLELTKACDATFTLVAIDENHKPRKITSQNQPLVAYI